MGICLSNSRKSSSPSFKNKVRVVHIDGFVEDFDHPITVQQVIGCNKHPKQFLCTPAQLLSEGSKPLKLDVQLKPGCIYLLLPDSALRADVSPVDFAALVRKLTAKANSNAKGTSRKLSQCSGPVGGSPGRNFVAGPVWNSPGRSPSRSPAYESGGLQYDRTKSSGSRSWKPVLDSIAERSFTTRSESDLQEMHLARSI